MANNGYPIISIKPVKNGYEVLNSFRFGDVIIKQGFISNGASVPRVFWWLLPPFHPDYITACIIHDYLCDKGCYLKADIVFNFALKYHPRSKKYRRVLFMSAVKSWHFVAYDNNNQDRAWLKLIKKYKRNRKWQKH